MISEEVKVKNLQEISEIMENFGSGWEKIVADGLTSALSHSLRTEVMKRVPRSNPHVHPEYRDPKSGFYHPSAGAGNLAKDFDIAIIRVSKGDVSARVGFSNVEYAGYVHEMQDPHPSGNPVEWSTPNTGNKFLETPVNETVDRVLEDLDKNIVHALKRIRA